MDPKPSSPLILEYAAQSTPFPGEEQSGDHGIVITTATSALLAVVDGAGHGIQAADAAQKAIDMIRDLFGQPLTEIVQACHECLRGTRGVTMAILRVDASAGSLRWISIGDVEAAVLHRGRGGRLQALISKPGIVGYRLPGRLREESLALRSGDLIAIASDGIRSEFSLALPQWQDLEPVEIANRVSGSFRKGTDDAYILVARYQGTEATGLTDEYGRGIQKAI